MECCAEVSVEWKRVLPAVAHPLYILGLVKTTQEVNRRLSNAFSWTGGEFRSVRHGKSLRTTSSFFSLLVAASQLGVTLRQGQWGWSHLRALPPCQLHLLVEFRIRSEDRDECSSHSMIRVRSCKTPSGVRLMRFKPFNGNICKWQLYNFRNMAFIL